jgi:hypothetical protein
LSCGCHRGKIDQDILGLSPPERHAGTANGDDQRAVPEILDDVHRSTGRESQVRGPAAKCSPASERSYDPLFPGFYPAQGQTLSVA